MQTAVKSGRTAGRPETGFLVPYWIHRIVILLAGMMVFFSPVNPGRILKQVNENASLFTTAFSYDNIATQLKSAISRGAVTEGDIRSVMTGCLIVLAGVLLCAVGGCMSAGNIRMKKAGIFFPLGGSAVKYDGPTRDEIIPKMAELRAGCDEAETLTAADYWPFPTYGDLLFGM